MLNFTPIARRLLLPRLRQHARYIDHAASVQQEQLVKLVEHAALTWFGRKYDFSTVRTHRDFAGRVPLFRYEDLQPAIMRMVGGEKSVLWAGQCFNFAQSSGTSDGKHKYIPITRESLQWNHYRGAGDVVTHYLNMNPASRLFAGKAMILGGSFANELSPVNGVRVGDLSATLINNINPIANLFRVPDKRTALLEDWNVKLPALVEAAKGEDITNLSGVPSWFLTVIKEVLKATGNESIHSVWPHLEVFFHGGIAFEPYREQYEKLCDMSKMHFVNTYNASEGFFATQSDWDTTAMLLLLDVGVFYEFIPLSDIDSDHPDVLPVWEIEQGKTYELVITACNGLWRYRIGDTVRVEQLNPVKISIAGRTRSFINAFGEELMEHNADRAIARAAQAARVNVLNYTAAPVYADTHNKGRHQWLVEFDTPPASVEEFAALLDKFLQDDNGDYQAKRYNSIFLDKPQVIVARQGIFDSWLAATGKLGGQRKVPRLSNNRTVIDAILKLM